MSDSLALISAARQALSEARTLPDMKAVRDTAETLRAYAKARGMGIESENMAAEIRLRAERMIGAELTRMLDAGERAGRGQWKVRPDYPNRAGGENATTRSVPTLAELGVERDAGYDWQQLARLDDDNFEAVVRNAYASGKRLARLDFSRIAGIILGPDHVEVGDCPPNDQPDPAEPTTPQEGIRRQDPWTPDWRRAVVGLRELGAYMDRGWPVAGDRTPRGWEEVDDEINSAGRSLLLFQKRVHGLMAALDVASPADKETPDVA